MKKDTTEMKVKDFEKKYGVKLNGANIHPDAVIEFHEHLLEPELTAVREAAEKAAKK